MSALNNKLNITSLVARKAATQHANRLFHAPIGIAQTFNPLGLCENTNVPELISRNAQDNEKGLQQHCPVYQIVPAAESNIKCINCTNNVPWEALATSSLMVNTSKPGIIAVCPTCATPPCFSHKLVNGQ